MLLLLLLSEYDDCKAIRLRRKFVTENENVLRSQTALVSIEQEEISQLRTDINPFNSFA